MRVTFWTLVVIAVISTGWLMDALGWRSGPVAGVTIAVSGATSSVAIALAVRILTVLSRKDDGGLVGDSACRIKVTSGDRRNAPAEPDAVALPAGATGAVGTVIQSTSGDDAGLKGAQHSR